MASLNRRFLLLAGAAMVPLPALAQRHPPAAGATPTTPTDFASTPGLDPNQLATAHYIDAHSAHPTPALAKIITVLNDAPTPVILAQDLNELSPESIGIFRNVAFNNASFFTEDVTDHLANLRDGLTGFDPSGLNVNNPSQSPQESQIKRHLDLCGPCVGAFGFEAELRKVIASRCKDHVPDDLITRVASALQEEHLRQSN